MAKIDPYNRLETARDRLGLFAKLVAASGEAELDAYDLITLGDYLGELRDDLTFVLESFGGKVSFEATAAKGDQ